MSRVAQDAACLRAARAGARGRRPPAPAPPPTLSRRAPARRPARPAAPAAPRRPGRSGPAAARSAAACSGPARASLHRQRSRGRPHGQRLQAATSIACAGNVDAMRWPRMISTRPSSSGWRRASSAARANSASSSRNSTPRCASVISPGRGAEPPPTSPCAEIVWCGARNGRSRTSRPVPRPAALWICVISSASSKVERRQDRRAAGGRASSCPRPAGRPSAGCARRRRRSRARAWRRPARGRRRGRARSRRAEFRAAAARRLGCHLAAQQRRRSAPSVGHRHHLEPGDQRRLRRVLRRDDQALVAGRARAPARRPARHATGRSRR